MTAKRSESNKEFVLKLDRGAKSSWFRITPHNRAKNDGEKVAVKDQIRLVNVKTGKTVLQTAVLMDDAYHVTLSTRATAWTILYDNTSIAPKHDALKVSSTITFPRNF